MPFGEEKVKEIKEQSTGQNEEKAVRVGKKCFRLWRHRSVCRFLSFRPLLHMEWQVQAETAICPTYAHCLFPQ